MNKFIATELKFMLDTMIVRTLSYPAFSMEVVLALVVFIVQCLLFIEIHTSVLKMNAKIRAKRRIMNSGFRFQLSNPDRRESLTLLQLPQFFQKNQETPSKIHFAPISKPGRHNMSDILKITLNRGDNTFTKKYLTDRETRAEYLLSITPSQYIKNDREKRMQQQGLRTCIESLATNLEKALSNDPIEIQSMVKDAVKRSLNTLKDNIDSQANSNYQLTNFPSPSFQNLLDQIEDKRLLQKSLSPDLISSIYVASNASGLNTRKSEIDIREIKSLNLSMKSSKSLNDILDIQNDLFEIDKQLMEN